MISRATRNIAFMACPEEDFTGLVHELTKMDPQGRWALVCFYPLPAPISADIEVISSTRSFTTAAKLWTWCLVHQIDRLVVCCRDLSQQTALQAVVQFASVCRARRRLLLDRKEDHEPIAAARPGTLAALAIVPFLLLVAVVVTRLGLRAWKNVAPPEPLDPSRGRTAILVPIVPDLSHTFVYREVLELKRRNPDYLVFSLERGDPSLIHDEAADLMQVSEFVPRLSAMRYLLAYLGLWLHRPRAVAALIRYFQPHTASFGSGARSNDDLCFLRLEYLQHSNYLAVGLMLAEFLRSRNVTYAHIYGSTSPSVRTLVAHRLYGIAYSISTYVDFEYWTPFHMLDRKFRNARFVVVCTQFCAGRLTERLPDLASKVRVLHHSLPAEYGASPQLRPRDDRSRLVYVGRFVPKKGLDTLIRACGILKGSLTNVTCHLYGAGSEEDSLRQLVTELELQQHVFFCGPVANQDFYTTMNRDDVFVCASRYMPDGERDGIPVTLLEAMAAGVTVVSTPVSGIPELIADRKNGYLVSPDDPGELASLLVSLIRNRERREIVSAAARSTVAERFCVEDNAAMLNAWISRETVSRDGIVAPGKARADESV